jgi:hypothetical protein
MPTIKMTAEALAAAKSLAVRYSGVNKATYKLSLDPDNLDFLMDCALWCDLLADSMEALGISDWAEWTADRYRDYAASCLERAERLKQHKVERLAQLVRESEAA